MKKFRMGDQIELEKHEPIKVTVSLNDTGAARYLIDVENEDDIGKVVSRIRKHLAWRDEYWTKNSVRKDIGDVIRGLNSIIGQLREFPANMGRNTPAKARQVMTKAQELLAAKITSIKDAS